MIERCELLCPTTHKVRDIYSLTISQLRVHHHYHFISHFQLVKRVDLQSLNKACTKQHDYGE